VARAICSAQLATIRSYEPGTRVGLDTEHLHKMRVATRRLRAALNIFRDLFDARNGDFLQRNFKWLAAVLGEVRDLDVHQLDVPMWRKELGADPDAGWQRFSEDLHQRWLHKRELLLKALETRRYQRLMERAEEAFSKTPTRRAGHPGLEPVGLVASRAVRKRVRQFSKAVKACMQSDDPEFVHQLRIIGKKVRYTCEFFRPLFDDEFYARVKRLAAFQDELGLFQDAVVAGLLAGELAEQAIAKGELNSYTYVLGKLVGWSEMRAQLGQMRAREALSQLGGRKLVKSLLADAEGLSNAVQKKQAKQKRADREAEREAEAAEQTPEAAEQTE
jgi:CHAD domain-containing protein